MDVVLLGATGFVGSAIVRRLAREEAIVHALVRGDPARVGPNVKVTAGALPFVPRELFPPRPFVVVHFATKQIEDKLGFDINVSGAERLASSLPPDCAGILYGSSASVYGVGAQKLIDETVKVAPTTALAKSRAAAEERLFGAGRRLDVPTIALRPRFIIGRGDRSTLPAFLRTFRQRLRIGNERQAFSIIDVDDYAEVVVFLAKAILARDVRLASGGLHVAHRQPVTLDEIRGALARRFGVPSPRTTVFGASAMARVLRVLPPTRALGTKLELVAHDHSLAVDRLASLGVAAIVDREPSAVLAHAVDAMTEEAE